MDNLVQFEEDFNSRTEKWGGGVDGYLRPDQFLDHLSVIIIKIYFAIWKNNQLVQKLEGCVV